MLLLLFVMDMRLKTNAVLQIVGPSGSGKTHFVCRLFTTPEIFLEKIHNIFWFMGTQEGEAGETLKCMSHI